jgi:hypothetical protein
MPTPRKYDNPAQRQAAYRARQATAQASQFPIPTVPGYQRWQVMMGTALAMLTNVHHEMDNYYQQRSEAWQESEKAESFVERMDTLGEIIDLLDELNTHTTKEKTIS